MCFCTNYQDVFTWIGAIILNSACIAIISSSSKWLATILCGIYAVSLYLMAQHFDDTTERRNTGQFFLLNDDNQIADSGVQSEAESEMELERSIGGNRISNSDNRGQQPEPVLQLIVSVFYGLSVFALGTTGALFSYALFPDSCIWPDGDRPQYYEYDHQSILYDICLRSFYRKQALLDIFTAILPMLALSMYLWDQKSTPSSGITAYVAIILLINAIFTCFDPEEEYSDAAAWMMTLISFTWTFGLSYQYIVSDDISKKDLCSRGITIGAIGSFLFTNTVIDGYDHSIFNLILLDALLYIPLIVLGLVIEHNLVLFLGIFGVFLEVWSFGDPLGAILQFIFFGIAGVGIFLLGSWLKQNQDLIREACLKWVLGDDETLIIGRRRRNENGSDNSNLEMERPGAAICCYDTQNIFAWIGAIMINNSFIGAVAFTVPVNMFLGFIFSIIYTGILYLMALYFGNKEDEDESNDTDEMNTTDEVSAVPIIQGMLYGLCVLALATSGVLLSLSIDAQDDYYSSYSTDAQEEQRHALQFIFLSIIPMTIASLYLWLKKFVPPCGLTAYLGVLLFGAALIYATDPSVDNIFVNPLYKAWVLVSSLIWTLTLSYKYLLLSEIEDDTMSHPTATAVATKRASYTWAINFGAITFFVIMFLVVKIYHDTITNWLMVSLFSFIPLIVLGVVIDHYFIVFLGVYGLYIDIARLTMNLKMMMLQFVILGFSGVGVVMLGFWIKFNQEMIRSPFLRAIRGSSERVFPETTTETESEAALNPIQDGKQEERGLIGNYGTMTL